jgi:hypothetical protein
MGNTRSSTHSSIDWLAKEPFARTSMRTCCSWQTASYAANTFSNYLGVVSHFAQWMHSRRLSLQSIDEALVAQFLDKHLPRCHCSGPVQRDRRTLSAALGHLLAVLRARGAIAPATVSSTPVDEELSRYDAYMDHVRGLAPKTRRNGLADCGTAADLPLRRRCRSTSRRSSPTMFAASSRNKPSFTASRQAPLRSSRRCAGTSATAFRWATPCMG